MGEAKDPALRAEVRAAVDAGAAELRQLGGAVDHLLVQLEDLADRLMKETHALKSEQAEPFLRLSEAARGDVDAHLSRQRDVLGFFNIALFGRTGAGKSSLLSALAKLDGHRVSRGESDWTVDVEPVPWDGCRLYDTPGINGWGRTEGRAELEAKAREAVEVADVVLLCFDSQSQQASKFTT